MADSGRASRVEEVRGWGGAAVPRLVPAARDAAASAPLARAAEARSSSASSGGGAAAGERDADDEQPALGPATAVEVRHRGNFSYIDGVLTDATVLKLCRLRYGGSAHQWGFAIYRASHNDYEDSFFPTGLPVGTCEDALDIACWLYLGDPTAWT